MLSNEHTLVLIFTIGSKSWPAWGSSSFVLLVKQVAKLHVFLLRQLGPLLSVFIELIFSLLCLCSRCLAQLLVEVVDVKLIQAVDKVIFLRWTESFTDLLQQLSVFLDLSISSVLNLIILLNLQVMNGKGTVLWKFFMIGYLGIFDLHVLAQVCHQAVLLFGEGLCFSLDSSLCGIWILLNLFDLEVYDVDLLFDIFDQFIHLFNSFVFIRILWLLL